MTELKRCPHCGKEQTYSNKNETIEYNNKSWRTCDHCLVEMPAWNTRPIEDELNARIVQLTAQLARRDEIITRLKEDAERLASTYVVEVFPHEWVCRSGCHHMGKSPATINHAPDCPITLHRQLVKKYEVTK